MDISKTTPNKTKAWYSYPPTPRGQEMDPAYTTTPGARTYSDQCWNDCVNGSGDQLETVSIIMLRKVSADKCED